MRLIVYNHVGLSARMLVGLYLMVSMDTFYKDTKTYVRI